MKKIWGYIYIYILAGRLPVRPLLVCMRRATGTTGKNYAISTGKNYAISGRLVPPWHAEAHACMPSFPWPLEQCCGLCLMRHVCPQGRGGRGRGELAAVSSSLMCTHVVGRLQRTLNPHVGEQAWAATITVNPWCSPAIVLAGVVLAVVQACEYRSGGRMFGRLCEIGRMGAHHCPAWQGCSLYVGPDIKQHCSCGRYRSGRGHSIMTVH